MQKQQQQIWQNNFPTVFWEFLPGETWGAAANSRESRCSRADVSHNPTSRCHRLKISSMRDSLETALKHSKLFQPTPEPGTWLIPGFFPDLHWCEKLPAAGGLPPGQSFKSPYLSQRAAFVLLWREGDPDRWPVFSRLERMKNATGGEKKIPVIFFFFIPPLSTEGLPTSLALGDPPRGTG